MQPDMKRTGENAYFAASNSRNGFHSYYEHCFRHRVDHLYCIKGGPGTGKSTLMRQVAREAEKRGLRVEYYYCSSDASSLDGVLLFGKTMSIGLIDATAPHAFEANLPGVEEEILDLGQYWDVQTLAARREDIVALNKRKKDGYRAAYRCLAGAGEVSDLLRDSIAPCLDSAKLQRTAARLMRGMPEEQEGKVQIALRDSVGMSGRVHFDTYLQKGERLCLLEDYYDTAYVLMGLLAQMASDRGQNMCVSYHPVLPDRIDALLLTASRTAFVVCASEEIAVMSERYPHSRVISMRRMVIRDRYREVREQVRRSARLREALLDEACLQLQNVAKAHFLLEQYYTAAMDFEAKERFTADFCRRLFDLPYKTEQTEPS